MTVTSSQRAFAQIVWAYHQMNHDLEPSELGLGLGSHDLGVADAAVTLYRQGKVPRLLFSGANSPTTREIFPDGEAIAYRDRAVALGVNPRDILVESDATNTGENFEFAKRRVEHEGLEVHMLTVVCKPYMQRRAYATCRMVWPEVEVQCYSGPLSYEEYVESIGDEKLVIDMLVGDLQRVMMYPGLGYAIEQDIPTEVSEAFANLVDQGFTSRLARAS